MIVPCLRYQQEDRENVCRCYHVEKLFPPGMSRSICNFLLPRLFDNEIIEQQSTTNRGQQEQSTSPYPHLCTRDAGQLLLPLFQPKSNPAESFLFFLSDIFM